MKSESKTTQTGTGTLRMLCRLTAGHRSRYLLAALAMVCAVALEYLVPLISQAVVDSLSAVAGQPGHGAPWIVELFGGVDAVVSSLWPCAGAMIVLATAGACLSYIGGRQIVLASERIVADLRERLYDHTQRLSCGYHDGHDTGDLVQRCTSDVETIRRFLSMVIIQIARTALMIAAVLPLMLSISPAMTGVAMSMTLPLLIFSVLFFSKVRATFKKADEAEGKLSARLQENLSGIRVVRAFARQDYEIERFSEVNEERRRWHNRLYVIMAWFWSASDALGMSQVVLVLGVGAYWASTGRLTVGALYVFVAWAWRYIFPLRSLGRVLTELGKAQVAMGRVLEILDAPVEQAAPGIVEMPVDRLEGRIEFEDVSFRYGDDAAALENVSFTIEPGEKVALLGPSGCGKTTVLGLILRFYDYDSGSIRLDGRELRTIERVSLRRQVSAALQEPFMYSRTIGENILVGNTDAESSQVRVAAEHACIHESIEKFERSYETMVGERGVTLSGGQRQRVSLARALVRDAPFLFLDDTLSAVDSETEQDILNALDVRGSNRTILVVAHRLSTLSVADRILVFEHGRLVEDGAPEVLRRGPGLYGRLWKMQVELEESFGRELTGAQQEGGGIE